MIRLLLDVPLYLSHHMVLAFAASCAVVFAAGALLRNHRPLYSLIQGRERRLITTTVSIGFAVFVAIGVWYLLLPGFAGEVEPVVSSLSWTVESGEPLYHELDAPERYSVLYGPSVFLTNGLFLKLLGPSLFSTKVASFLGAVLSLLLLYGALARRRLDTTAAAMCGLAILYYWAQGFAVYLVRPDALILVSVSFALMATARAGKGLAGLAVAVALGFAINLKVHAGLYFLPALGLLVDRWGWRCLLWVAPASAAVVLAPFVFHDQVSLRNYLLWLGNATRHGLTSDTLVMTTRFAIFLLLPLFILPLVGSCRAAWARRHRMALLALGPSMLAVLLLSNKPGAGVVHLLPMVPTIVFLAGRAARSIGPSMLRAPLPRRSAGLAYALLLTVLMTGTVRAYQAVRLAEWNTSETREMCSDIEGIMAHYDGLKIAMACGGEEENFRRTWLRPLLVFRDNPLFIDPIAVMDCCLSGRPVTEATSRALIEGRVDLWLVPRQNEPFVKKNWYPPHAQIFTDEFIARFHEHFVREGSSRFFDLWFWDGLDPAQRRGPTTTLAGAGADRAAAAGL